jgi:hypothetical protein
MGINSTTSAITAPDTSSGTSPETSPETGFLKVVGNEKGEGWGGWKMFKDVFVFSSTYFRFRFVKTS